jgi:hypothetical protein
MKNNKTKKNYQLPSVNGIDVMDLLSKIKLEKNNQVSTPPPFTLEIGIPANNIGKQLKQQKIDFDPRVINTYDKLIKSINKLKQEEVISNKKANKLIHIVYEKSIKHVYFIYEMI